MFKKRLISVLLVLTLVLTSAGFVFADEQAPAGEDPVVTEEPAPAEEPVTAEEPAPKLDQVITAPELKTITITKTTKVGAKLTTGDGALTYATSDKKVATVTKSGIIKAKAVGTATITVTASETEAYNAQVIEVTVKVIPKGIAVQKVFSKKSAKLTAKWAAVKKIDGFEIQYTNKDKTFKKAKKTKLKNPKATKVTVEKLKKHQKYFVRVRTYKVVNGETYYSNWSKVKSVKVK